MASGDYCGRADPVQEDSKNNSTMARLLLTAVGDDDSMADHVKEESKVEDMEVDGCGPVQDRHLYVPLPLDERKKLGMSFSGFGLGSVAEARRKETFFCTLCNIQLSSRDTMRSHAKGRQHCEAASVADEALPPGAKRQPYIKQIPNPESLRKKMPLKLEVKLLNKMKSHVVGLRAVVQFETVSDPEVEPYYLCLLCNVLGEANQLANHVIHKDHMRNFVLKQFADDPIRATSITENNENLYRFCKLHNETMFLKLSGKSLVKKYQSDLLFPQWPHGRAPGSTEKDGEGDAPINSWEKLDKVNPATLETDPSFRIWREYQRDKHVALKQIDCRLLNPYQLKEVDDRCTARSYVNWLEDLVERIGEVNFEGKDDIVYELTVTRGIAASIGLRL